GGTMYLLNSAWGFGSGELSAPQANIMKMIVAGVMEGNLPWNLVLIGACIAVLIEIIGIPVLPFAIGVYLPVHLNACIMVGGLVRLLVEKVVKSEDKKKAAVNDGTLFCSGMIAGEGLVGILLAVLTVFGVDKAFDLSAKFGLPAWATTVGGLVMLAASVALILVYSLGKKKQDKK
ncbi:MAG: OPT/YSL family transporter, partial [Clostridia bacterium]|nr:OPT/YSL family transporter [Clostridia bacterium]